MRRVDCPVPLAELRRLYLDEKLPARAIVERLGEGATLKRVRAWRKRFGIETLQTTERHEVLPIVGRLRSLLVGSMLGDGRLDRLATSTRYMEYHCDPQRDYIEWKAERWGIWVKAGLKPVVKELNGEDFFGWRFETVAHATLNEWHALFYDETGPKLLRPAVVDHVDAFALAIWFLDDGSAGWWPRITFGMKPESREIAMRIFEKFSLRPRWETCKGNTGNFLFEGEDQAHLFIALVKSHLPKCMAYKLAFGFQGRHYQIRQALPEEQLRAWAAAGVPIKRLARETGFSASVISRHLKKYGIPHPRKMGRPTVEPV